MIRCFLFLTFLAAATFAKAQSYMPTEENLVARQAFADARFGIFLHWGIYSVFGQGEWYMTNQNINHKEYAKAANAFYPHDFNANEWVKAFKEAGARYITFTTRHHDGFSMWHTKQSTYNIKHTPFKRDILRELADACHTQEMPLHLYYSHLDWTRDDYPKGRTGLGTGRTGKEDWKSYYQFMNAQLTELLSNYGKINCIWFDGWWDHDEDSVSFDWKLGEQYALIHKLQPACLVANNHHQTPFEGEDFQIFERDVPGENKAGLSGQDVSKLPLETCQTMNGMWGYKVVDQNYKSADELIHLLVRTAAKGANLLLNIGPQPDGNLPDTALARLKDIGKWLANYGESIYGTTHGEVVNGEQIVSTRKGNTLFLHLLQAPKGKLSFNYNKKIMRIERFPEGEAVKFTQKKGIVEIENLDAQPSPILTLRIIDKQK